MYAHLPGQIAGLRVAISVGAYYCLVVMAGVLITTGLFPRQRHLVDAVAVSRLGFALFVVAAPDMGQPLASSALVSATIVVGSAVLLFRTGPSLFAYCSRGGMPTAIQRCAEMTRSALVWIDGPGRESGLKVEARKPLP